MSVGIGAPILFSLAEKRDKERIEEIREINRATLKATGATLSEVRAPSEAPGGRCLQENPSCEAVASNLGCMTVS